LRMEFIEKKQRAAMFNPAFLKSKGGDEVGVIHGKEFEGALRLTPTHSEASTEDGGDDFDDGDSDNSDLPEGQRLERALAKITRLEHIAETAIKRGDQLQSENEAQAEEIHNLHEKLAEMEEKMELLEEADDRWREKNAKLRLRQSEDWLALERARMNRCDFEDRVRPVDGKMTKIAKKVRRWDMAFNRVADLLKSERRKAMLKQLWQVWRSEVDLASCEKSMCVADSSPGGTVRSTDPAKLRKLQERIEELEAQLEEVSEFRQSIEEAQTEIARLRAEKLEVMSKLMHVDDTTLIRNALGAWVNLMPTLRLERQQEELIKAHENLTDKFNTVSGRLSTLQRLIDGDERFRELQAQYALLRERQGLLQEDLEKTSQCSVARASKIRSLKLQHDIDMKAATERLQATVKALKEEIVEIDEAWQQRYGEAEEHHVAVQRRLSETNDALEARVDDLTEALYPEGASGEGRASRPPRVVAHTRGVLCAGCLTQILYRDVRPINSVEDLQGMAKQHIEKEKADLFEKTVGGPDPHDPAHSFLFQRFKDPPMALQELDPKSVLESPPLRRPRSASQLVQRTHNRPSSAVDASRRKSSRGGKAEALRGEVSGFRNMWRG